jgi:hypothetical protein
LDILGVLENNKVLVPSIMVVLLCHEYVH